jgi:hypothetical protein
VDQLYAAISREFFNRIGHIQPFMLLPYQAVGRQECSGNRSLALLWMGVSFVSPFSYMHIETEE